MRYVHHFSQATERGSGMKFFDRQLWREIGKTAFTLAWLVVGFYACLLLICLVMTLPM